ncbi:MAG: guanylyltransferase [Thalassobius sp.]|nr:guanylyltransferase [Thalassovita sp.]
MKFNELDKQLRIYETAHDFCVPPNMYIVARIDGRGFTHLTKEKHDFKRPFDERFRDIMMETVSHLMNCGFKVTYGYTQSDEISLLFDLNETAFARKTRKINSILAGEASAKFSLLLNDMGVFDCRLSQLPSDKLVVDYFRWRNEDAHRNALNAHCYWLLREQGKTVKEATKTIEGKSTAFKNELLFQNGINFNNLPLWQKRGIGLYWHSVEKQGWNPVKQQEETTLRKEIKVDDQLPMGDAYSEFIKGIL